MNRLIISLFIIFFLVNPALSTNVSIYAPAYKNQSIIIDLSGSSNYKISLNKSRYNLNSGRHQLSLKKGLNRLEVSADHDCNGKFKKDIYLSEESTIYPNPAIKEVNLLVGGQASNFKISIFSVEGNLIEQYQGEKLPNDRKLSIPVDYLPPGVYFINIDSGDKTETLKLLKR